MFMHPFEERPLRTTFVLWGGYIGGAENFTAELARAMQAQGAEPEIVFVLEGAALADRLESLRIPYSAIGLRRGRAVLAAPRRFARAVSKNSPDVAILVSSGYLAAALRGGGYRAPIIGIEHGSLLQLHRLPPLRRMIRTADRISGTKACSILVAVSEYMRERIMLTRPRRRVVCIPNGVDLERFSPSPNGATPSRDSDQIVIGCASRLVEGKGVEDVIRALTYPSLHQARLRIAGDGPCNSMLKALARSLQVDERTNFVGPVLDMPAFWRGIDVAVVPSNGAVESFGMAAVEAMACATPVVVSNSGALPHLVVVGETGRVVLAGDVSGIAGAISEYAHDAARRTEHGSNGRRRCEAEFAIDQTASRYLNLCTELICESTQPTPSRAGR
jgi:glycosyltransferase involved in cell wall biosynthesis